MEQEELIKQRKEKVINFFKNKKVWVYLAVLILLLFAWSIRTSNVEGLKDITTGGYTLGPDLDPFLFLRYAEYIVDNGSLFQYDSMRYVPLGYNTAQETQLLPYMIAYFHYGLKIFKSTSIEYSAAIFPAFMFLLTALAFFLFVSKVFDKEKSRYWIASIATAFLIVSPSLLSRTVAGIPEKESVGFLFMFLAFYFYLCSWKSAKMNSSLIHGLLAGISTALMGLVWGGWVYILTVIAVFTFFAFILGALTIKRIYSYLLWLAVSFILILVFSARYTFIDLLTSTASGAAVFVFGLLLIDSLVFRTSIRKLRFIQKLRSKIPDRVVSVICLIIIGFVLSSIFFGISFIPNFVGDIVMHLTQPYQDRLAFTVAENRQPYYSEWEGSFGPIIGNFPLVFWLFFVGSILLFYESINQINKKDKIFMVVVYILFLTGLIFSRHSSSGLMNGENSISKIVYFGSFLLILLGFCYIFYTNYKRKDLEGLKNVNFSYLFLLIFFIVSLIGARSAIRLIMALAPPAVAIVGYFSVILVVKSLKNKEETLKTVYIGLAIIVVLLALYSFYINYQQTLGGAKSMVPSIYTNQWQNAMAWVRENTPESAVFSHWWDYGYWLQSIGKRATVLDGGNAIPYWNHLFGRHVLTGQSETGALEFLKIHNATHLLIDSTDIGKYSAYSTIGSDEEYDRFSWIGTYLLNDKATQEKRNETIFFYQGGVSLDEDYLFQSGEERIFLPAGRAGIGALRFTTENQESAKQPEAIFVYQDNQYSIPLRFLYYNSKLYDFGTGYQGAMYIMTRVDQQGQSISANEIGAALFLSERNMRALWVKMYLLNQFDNFKLVHSEPDLVIQNLNSQGLNTGEIIYFNGIRGPIKIWAIEYPPYVENKSEYLETTYPPELQIARQVL